MSEALTNEELIEWMAYFSHIRDIETGKEQPEVVHIEDVETRSRLIDESFFGRAV